MPIAMYTAEEVEELVEAKIKPLVEAIAKLSANDPKPVEPEQPKPVDPVPEAQLKVIHTFDLPQGKGGEWDQGFSIYSQRLTIVENEANKAAIVPGNFFRFVDGTIVPITKTPSSDKRIWAEYGGDKKLSGALGHPNKVEVLSGVAVAPVPKPEPMPAKPIKDWHLGINLGMGMGASGRIPGIQGTDFSFPVESEIIRAKGYGFRRFRVGGLFERFFKTLGSTEMYKGHDARGKEYSSTSVIRVGRHCYAHGCTVKWDAFHNYGKAFGKKIGSPGGLTVDQFAQAWRAFILHVKSDPQAWAATYGFDLMNEWVDMDFKTIFDATQRVIDVCADILEDKMIVPEGNHYSSTLNWVTNNNGFQHLKDPRGPGLIEFSGHLYLDDDASGYYKSGEKIHPWEAGEGVTPETVGAYRMTKFANWIEKHGFRGNIGETIVPGDMPRLLKGLENMLLECRRRGIDVYIFGMGDWFDDKHTTVHNIEIARNKPTLDLLQKFTKGQI